MKNFVQSDEFIDVTLGATVVSGAGALIGTGGLFGVATNGGVSGDVVPYILEGVVSLPKDAPLVITLGDKLYWDDTAKEVNKTALGNTLVGVAQVSAASADTTCFVRLNGVPA